MGDTFGVKWGGLGRPENGPLGNLRKSARELQSRKRGPGRAQNLTTVVYFYEMCLAPRGFSGGLGLIIILLGFRLVSQPNYLIT